MVENSNDIFEIFPENNIPSRQGINGKDGKDGRGIVSITYISTSGLIDLYRILYTDATTQDFNVTNGENGVNGLDGTDGTNGTNGNDGASAYAIWLALGNVGTPTDFMNSLIGATGDIGATGADGRGIISITLSSTIGLVDTYTISYSDSSSSIFTVTNGAPYSFPTPTCPAGEATFGTKRVYIWIVDCDDTPPTPKWILAEVSIKI